MTHPKSPQERVAAAVQLRATLTLYLEREFWTPLEAILILCGIHPPPGCEELPLGGVGLDNVPLHASAYRFSKARELLKHWQWHCEDEVDNGRTAPPQLSLYELIRWCEDGDIETEWLPLFQDVIGYRPDSNSIDFIPSAVAAYASRTAHSVDAILSRLDPSISKEESIPAARAIACPKFRGELAGVLTMAWDKADNKSSYRSVFNALVELASGNPPPDPLIEYLPQDQAIKWRDYSKDAGEDISLFTKENMCSRMRNKGSKKSS